MTSGAIQCGVPMKVFRLDIVLVSWAATPKSATLTCPVSVTRMLPALMSRCTYSITPWLCLHSRMTGWMAFCYIAALQAALQLVNRLLLQGSSG